MRSALIFSENLDSPAAADVAYKKLVSTSDEAAVLEAARKMAAEKPHFAYKDELEYLKKVLNGSLTFQKPVDTFVDYPEYRVWKAFAPGAKVTYASRVLQPERYGSDHFIPGQLKDRHAYLLQSINDDQAQLWFTETIYDANGTAHPPRDTEIAYPAKYAQPAAPAAAPAQSGEEPTAARGKGSAARTPQATVARTRQSPTTTATALVPGRLLRYTMPASAPIESGEETIEINAKRIATRWQSVSYSFNASSPYKDCSLIVKVWTSDQVPSGLVRKTEDKTCPGDKNHPSTRFIEETILESVECNGLNIAAAPDPRNQGPPVIQLSTVKPASATPDAEPAPTKPAQQQTPVPARTPPPRSGARPASSPVPTGQNALMQRYSVVIGRAGRAKVQLAQLERKQAGQGTELPADVRDARDRLDAQLKAVIVAMQKRDNAQSEQSLQSFEGTVSVIENYLKQ